ncbi:NPC intracellular cholesterol transporter 2 homolog a-like [Contarinia nasturtii]|uniref:NPC intracellular cholesterol transporter 2 homolog a-like n=1 Tax=Contarinia nasturtii TaxID=265458 RepID=UPI0012D3CDFC|nr:NPC intracellular cholesterol transporter 2 homolog a-like [Contarinia nasturtii]
MDKFLVLTLTFALIFGSNNALEFKDCGSELGKFSKVVVSNCDEASSVCVLKRHTNATIDLDFNLVDDSKIENVSTVVHGVILGVEMPFPLANPNACVDSGIECPLEKGKNYNYQQTLPVLKSYPKVSVTVKWELKDVTSAKTIICVLIPARIE